MARRLSGAALLADLEAAERTGLKTKAERDAAKKSQYKVNSKTIPHNRGLGKQGKQSKNDSKPDEIYTYNKKGEKVKRPNSKKPENKATVAQNLAYLLFREDGATWEEAREGAGLTTV